ncbi:mRNA cleavage and polyadenylation factor CLP1 P-loop [Popillia japonica]|uniref:mRNA cleavage and polyadenylation factor CLP1 P-loop n=1 Tax=Popillia japonica TaxID=7064 RepID=A0AAW1N7N3_POPJA
MSYKERLVKLLKTEVKVPTRNTSKETGLKRSSIQTEYKNKKKRKKTHTKRKTCNGNSLNSSPSSTYSNSNGNDVSAIYSDSDVEINVSTSNESDWVRKLETDITPSKSEYLESLPKGTDVDTIYHVPDNATENDIFSTVEDVSYNEDDDDCLILGNETVSEMTVDKDDKACVDCYNINNGKVLHIRDKNNVYLHGSCNLTRNSSEVSVHSLRGFSYLFLQNVHDGNYSYSKHLVKIELYKHGMKKIDVGDIFSQWNVEDSIVMCKNIDNFMLPYIEKHISQKILPLSQKQFPMLNTNDIGDINMLEHSLQWDVINLINKNTKLMICGGKGVGKNPGQPEFTISGCVSAVVVKTPILGPNFTHLRKPDRCIFINNIDVGLEPDQYIKCVIELLKQCEDFKGVPTLVNYIGYTQSYAINIDLTVDAVAEYSNMFGRNDIMDLCYDLIMIDSMSDKLTSWQAQGRTTREMCILSYFSQIVDETLSLTSKNVPLYKISLNDITLVCANSKEITNKLAVFNANLVGLCSVTDASDIYNCHGWGVVRGISDEVLVLITPAEEDILDMVTHLLIGSVTLPASVLMYEDTNVGLIPYVSLGCKTKFNFIPKRSYLPKKMC